jgi:hypothetical protein
MSKTKARLSTLIDQLSRSQTGTMDASKYIQSLIVATPIAKSLGRSVDATESGVRPLSAQSTQQVHAIQFGKVPSTVAANQNSGGGAWRTLLSNTLAGGASNALGNGLSAIGGLGGLISDIAGLFGEQPKATPPPLSLFALPSSIQATVYIGPRADRPNPSRTNEQNALVQNTESTDTSKILPNNTPRTPLATTTDSAAIAQAVKHALLSSNTLGDVIAEL